MKITHFKPQPCNNLKRPPFHKEEISLNSPEEIKDFKEILDTQYKKTKEYKGVDNLFQTWESQADWDFIMVSIP